MDHAHDAVQDGGDHDGYVADGAHDDGRPDLADSPPLAAAPVPVIPATVSGRLREAREALGMTTADIAARTRITLRHVNALDRGDLASLPGRPYVMGFVRSYARVVGLDEAAMAALARKEMETTAAPPPPRTVHQFDVDDPAKTPSRTVTWIAIGLVVAVLGAGAVFWRSYLAPDAALPSLVSPALVSNDPSPVPSAPAAAAAPPAAQPAGPVVFTAREDGIWVKFYDGHGTQLLQKQLALNESYTVPADAIEPRLWTGRPDALAITIGGQAVPALSDHRGIMRDVPVTAQALLARTQPASQPAAQFPGQPPVPGVASGPASGPASGTGAPGHNLPGSRLLRHRPRIHADAAASDGAASAAPAAAAPPAAPSPAASAPAAQ